MISIKAAQAKRQFTFRPDAHFTHPRGVRFALELALEGTDTFDGMTEVRLELHAGKDAASATLQSLASHSISGEDLTGQLIRFEIPAAGMAQDIPEGEQCGDFYIVVVGIEPAEAEPILLSGARLSLLPNPFSGLAAAPPPETVASLLAPYLSKVEAAELYALIANAGVSSVAGRTGAVVLAKSDVGLANVNNTSDANKPVSTAQATAIASLGTTLTASFNEAYEAVGQDLQNETDARISAVSALQAGLGEVSEAVGLVQGAINLEQGYREGDVANLQGQINVLAPINSPSFSGNASAPTTSAVENSDRIATTSFVQNVLSLAVTGLLKFQGDIACAANPNYPAASKGHSYCVSSAGKIGGASGVSVDIGDMIICKVTAAAGTQAAVGASWFVLEHNLAGALLAANNLGDITNAATARANLVLGNVENTALSTGNAGSASRLATARNINGVPFDGTTPITLAGYDALSTIQNGEVSITGATTLTSTAFGKWHACSGTTANYTLALPAVSGNAGKFIGLRMAPGLTKLVTLDGNASETIDGALTRIMWAGETAVLYCDGAAWFKVAGKSLPMQAVMALPSNQSISAATITLVNTTTIVSDNTGLMADAPNKRIGILRPGVYALNALVTYTSFPANKLFQTRIHKNGAGYFDCPNALGVSSYVGLPLAKNDSFAAGDYLDLRAYHEAVAANDIFGSGQYCSLSASELISW